MFSHEKFQAYQLSITFWEMSLVLTEKIPQGNANLREQFRRASVSIPLNIAEGCGRRETRDRKRFFAIARGSAMECAAVTDLLVKLDPSLANDVKRSKAILLSITNILSTVLLK